MSGNGHGAARAWTRMLAVCGLVVGLDQAAKGAVTESLALGERVELVLGVDLAHVTNRGIAFGLLDDGRGLVLAVTGVALGLVVAWFASDPARPGLWLGVGLLTGGALGNLADRIRADAVTDYLDPPLWPAFNLADVAITAGVAVIVLAALTGAAEAEP
ncbi:MAG: signal peptidase II [Solirubrobacterales bacterium]